VAEISFTDVSLVRLSDGLSFTNETLENMDGVVPQFQRLITSDDRAEFKPVHFNSAFTGHMEGNIVMHSVKMPDSPSHPTEQSQAGKYVLYQWHYMGQGDGSGQPIMPPDGTCGSAIWNDDGVILGFYH